MKNRYHYFWKSVALRVPAVAIDMMTNMRHVRSSQRILIARHVAKQAYMFRDFLDWVSKHVPELRGAMEFRRLPFGPADVSRYVLHVCWANDTMDLWSPNSFAQALRLQEQCSRVGIPVINRVDCLARTAKRQGAELMRVAGVRTPHAVAIKNEEDFRRDFGGLSFPFLIREDRGHGQPAFLIEDPKQLDAVELARFRSPIATEYIDTRGNDDGLYRKYRYVMAGKVGVPRHLIVNGQWEVRPEHRLKGHRLREEELNYVNRPDPNHDVLDRARRALGLDVVGFDYSYDRDGRVVVWEANPFLNLNYPENRAGAHIAEAVKRSFAVVARLYCQRAGIMASSYIDEMLYGIANLDESESDRSEAA
jgi:glutathione synthase/RimK-type ligase-like ATP-grasp enzyme